MRTLPTLVGALALLVVSCGDDADEASSSTTGAPTSVPATTVVTTTVPATTVLETTEVPTTVPATTVLETTVVPTTDAGEVVLEQPAIWPAADVVFDTPEAAAADFVAQVLGEGPTLGEFQAGDSRSGEMLLYSPGEGSAPVQGDRGLLLLRQLGPNDGWFLIGIANDEASITSPETMAVVPAGPLTVEGIGHGFEANLVARAYVAGDADALLDMEITMAGSMEAAGPYTVTLDLSDAAPGDMVMLLVRTGAGLETDPGEVGAIPVVIAD